jgi:hypothetical protein
VVDIFKVNNEGRRKQRREGRARKIMMKDKKNDGKN